MADMERKINARTRAILLITPNNPTGAVYSKQTLEKILELARRHGLIIFADEIYDKLIFDPAEKHVSIATLATDVPIVTFNGLSKAYLVPGWRIGWAIATGPREVLHPYMEAVHRLLRARLSAPHPFQHAIKPALEGPQDHLVEVLRKLRKRAELTVEWAKRTPRVKLVAPKGAFYAYPYAGDPGGRSGVCHRSAEAEACAGGTRIGIRREAGDAAHAHRLPAARAGAGRSLRQDDAIHERALKYCAG